MTIQNRLFLLPNSIGMYNIKCIMYVRIDFGVYNESLIIIMKNEKNQAIDKICQ